MKPLELRIGITVALLLLFQSVTTAQDEQPVSRTTSEQSRRSSRIEIGLAFAQTIGSSTFSASRTLREYVEDGTFNSSYRVGGAAGGGFDLQYNLGERYGGRLGAQTFSRKSTGDFDARIPHPFFFDQSRSISGSESGLGFSEAAYSLTGVYRGGAGPWSVSLEGGPAYFSVNATVAEKATYAEIYPYDTATYSGIVSAKRKASPIGFALGLEVGRRLAPAASVVVQGRFTQGSGDLDFDGQKIRIKAGGAQVRLGLRFVLARKRVGG